MKLWTWKLLPLDYAMLAALMMVVIVVGGQTAYLLTQVAGPLRCQAEQNQQFRDALSARTDATTRERQAQREFLGSRFTPTDTARYLAALDVADRDRANNPLPRASC